MEKARIVLLKGEWPMGDAKLTFPSSVVKDTAFDPGGCLISSVLNGFHHIANFLGEESLKEEQVRPISDAGIDCYA
jgi:hypothetical protein